MIVAATTAHTSATPSLTFYSVAATVIPVFLITALFQAKAPESLFDPAIRLVAVVLFLVTAVIGEISALHVLSTGHPTSSAKSGVSVALEVLGFLLVAGIVIESIRTTAETHPKFVARPGLFYGTFIVILAVFWFAALRAAEHL
jgi:hypothetical protein